MPPAPTPPYLCPHTYTPAPTPHIFLFKSFLSPALCPRPGFFKDSSIIREHQYTPNPLKILREFSYDIIAVMDYIYYHCDCPTCKNQGLILVEAAEAELEISVDKRYTFILPDVWGEEAKRIGEALPFLYKISTKETLHVDLAVEDMREQVKAFLKGEPLTEDVGTSNATELV